MSVKFLKLSFSALILLWFFSIVPAQAATIGTSVNTLTNGLVGWWTFDGKDMTSNVADKSGQSNNGSLQGFGATSTAVVAGKIGQALKFDGVNDYVNIGQPTALAFDTGDFTVSAWANCSTGLVGTTNKEFPIFGNSQSNWQLGFYLEALTWGNKGFTSYINGVSTSASTGLIPGLWYHVVTVRRGTYNYIYVNGILKNTKNDAAIAGSINYQNYRIGSPTVSTYNFSGSLDDVRVYNRALSASEVNQLYKMGGGKIAASNASPAANINSGLVGYWTFDGKDLTSNVADKSGQGNNGSLQGFGATSTAVVAGKVGQALKFDGISNYVSVGNPSVLQTPSAGTVEGWVKVGGWTVDEAPIIVKGVGNSWNQANWRIAVRGSASAPIIHFCISDGTAWTPLVNYTTKQTSAISYNKWYHLALVWYKTDKTYMLAYLDGQSLGSSYITNDMGTAYSIFLGKWGTTNNYFNGSLDDIRIYNRALSAAEVSQLYQIGKEKVAASNSSPAANINSGLVGYWTFDGKDMTSNVADKSGQGNNGSLQGFGATSTAVVAGKVGQGLKFDGAGNYVLATSSTSLNITKNITMSAWTKIPKSSTNSSHVIISKGYSTTGYGLSTLLDTQIVFFGGGTYKTSNTFNSIADSIWHLVTTTYDKSNVYFFLDGRSVGSSALTANSPSTSFAVAIGKYWGSPWPYSFQGSLDDVRVYNRALSAQEVGQLYNMGR